MNLLELQEKINKTVNIVQEIYGIHPKDVKVKVSSIIPPAGKCGSVSKKAYINLAIIHHIKQYTRGRFENDGRKLLVIMDK